MDSKSFAISILAFSNGSPIPRKYTCDGENISPALSWSGTPAGTNSLALICDDPDAPVGIWVHWVIYNIPPTLNSLPEKVPTVPQVSGTGSQGVNDFKRMGYGGPCPPRGAQHRYYFKLYALSLAPMLAAGMTSAQLQRVMSGHILAEVRWMGTYKR